MIRNLNTLLDECLSKLNLGKPEEWTDSTYIYLQDKIQEHTRERLGKNTLKRLFKNYYNTGSSMLPKISTLNIIARFAGYSEWYDYINDEKKESSNNKKTIIYVSLTLLILILLFALRQHLQINTDRCNHLESIDISPRAQVVDLSNSFIFDYSIPNKLKDSFYLDIQSHHNVLTYKSNSGTHFYLAPGNNLIRFEVKDPGPYTWKISNKKCNSISKKLFAANNEWQYIIYSGGKEQKMHKYNVVKNENGIASIDKNKAIANGIDSIIWFNTLRYIKVLPVSLDNCILEYRILNYHMPDPHSNYMKNTFYGKNNIIQVFLNSKSSFSRSRIQVSDNEVWARNNELKSFNRNYNQWHTIRIELKDKNAYFYINDTLSHSQSYSISLDTLVGFSFWSYAGIALDYMRVFDKKGELIYGEEFE